MKKGYKECPFCKNEIKEGAIKCQFCHELLGGDGNGEKIEKKIFEEDKKSNEETILLDCYSSTTRSKRFWAAFYDFIINFTIIGLIYNVIIAFRKGETFGFNAMGIKFISDDGNKLTWKQRFYRFILYWPINIFSLITILITDMDVNVFDGIIYIGIGIIIFNIIERFFKSPTFYEKILGIKKIQYNKGNWWADILVFILIILGIMGSKVNQRLRQEQLLRQYFNTSNSVEQFKQLNSSKLNLQESLRSDMIYSTGNPDENCKKLKQSAINMLNNKYHFQEDPNLGMDEFIEEDINVLNEFDIFYSPQFDKCLESYYMTTYYKTAGGHNKEGSLVIKGVSDDDYIYNAALTTHNSYKDWQIKILNYKY